MSDREYTRRLKQHDWDKLYKETVVRAGFKIQRYEWNEDKPDAEDIADQAVTLVIKGEAGHRRWDPSQRDLRDHLLGVVDSLVWNRMVKSSNSKRSQLPKIVTGDDERPLGLEELCDDPDNEFASMSLAIEDAISNADEADRIADKVMEAFGDDETLVAVFDMLMDSRPPREIAQKLELTNTDVYNLQRKIEMKLKPFFPQSLEPRRSSRRPKEN